MTARFAGYGLAFAVLAALGAISLGARWPLMIPMLQFLAPSRLWLLLLIPALVGLYLLLIQRKRNCNKQVGRTMFDLVIPRDRTWLRHLAVGLSILSLLTLTLAFAKPKDEVSVPRAGDDCGDDRCLLVHGGNRRGAHTTGGRQGRG